VTGPQEHADFILLIGVLEIGGYLLHFIHGIEFVALVVKSATGSRGKQRGC